MNEPRIYVNSTHRTVAVSTRLPPLEELPPGWSLMVGDPIAERDWAIANLIHVCDALEAATKRRLGLRSMVRSIARIYRGEADLMQRTVGRAPGLSLCPECQRPLGSGHLGTCSFSQMQSGPAS